MSIQARIVLFLFLIGLSILDGYLTESLLNRFGFIEANPVHKIFQDNIPYGMWILKSLAIGVVCIFFQRVTNFMLVTLNILMALVCLNNFYFVIWG
ncbi:MAG: DUF5658 family protein [Planctomycetota bacterium]|nr:DUF5658 family protein [Planctomycetota bacterium]